MRTAVRSRHMILVAVIMTLGIMLAASVSGCEGDTADPVSSSTVTVSEVVPTTLELAAGDYLGEYCFVEPARDEVYEMRIEVGQDGSFVATAVTREGPTIELTGTVDEDGTVTAAGMPARGDDEVSLKGEVLVGDGVVSIEGVWETTKQELGTWGGEKTTE